MLCSSDDPDDNSLLCADLLILLAIKFHPFFPLLRVFVCRRPWADRRRFCGTELTRRTFPFARSCADRTTAAKSRYEKSPSGRRTGCESAICDRLVTDCFRSRARFPTVGRRRLFFGPLARNLRGGGRGRLAFLVVCIRRGKVGRPLLLNRRGTRLLRFATIWVVAALCK